MSRKSCGNYVQVNKRHWNAIARHGQPEKRDLFGQIKDGESYLERWEPKLSPYLKHVKGKKIVVPQFGDGLVMLALAKKGAIVTGVDFSSEQVHLAGKNAEHCGLSVRLVEADWQKLPGTIPRNHFDLVVTECGIFMWIKRLDSWMKNAQRVLKRGGKLIVTDFHPLSMIAEEKNGQVTFKRSYFDQSPDTHQPAENASPAVEFRWKLSDMINAAVQAGLRIDCLEEFFVGQGERVPLLPTDFLLVASKR